MSARSLPVRPDLDQLKNQAKDLLKAYRDGDAEASADFAELHPDTPSAGRAKLADAQLVLARIYGASSWTRIVQCCQLIDAIWDDDLHTVRRLVTANRNLLIEDARIVSSNWGPPMSYAANLGRDRIIRLLYELGARDLWLAMGRAVLQSRIETAEMLNEMLGKPAPPERALGGAAYTLSVPGTEFVFRRGFQIRQGADKPVETVIGSDSRRLADKRRILELSRTRLHLPRRRDHGVPSWTVRSARTTPGARSAAAVAAVCHRRHLSAGSRLRSSAVRGDGHAGRRRHPAAPGGVLG